jgi:ribosomal-protein-alanine N-acetyltransferase
MIESCPVEKADYVIRPMKDEDIPQVSEIDRQAFPAESLFRPYTSYRQEIHNSVAHYLVACTQTRPPDTGSRKQPWFRRFLARLATMQASAQHGNSHDMQMKHILGFVGLWIMLNEAHIIAIAVERSCRRLGIGEDLLIAIIDLAAQLNADFITLEVRASNTMAQALYEKYGFHVVGRRSGYYSDNGEDAVLMSTDSIRSEPFRARCQHLKRAHTQKWKNQ